ncbi:AMP-binding protein [Pokkaliibacter sp. MBI-7]|uniref:AMP-binding protein n=1 Tax=Pokkaliibacter sp. MBI-7 TaxID=3040600 RepID=UPI00244D5543|nr:AMP-binding protein [Pokkaliibacter sp. MBI-7]MDH2433890.1 AMP-binding protein [Pokkaliibacter sp. MBI-7]
MNAAATAVTVQPAEWPNPEGYQSIPEVLNHACKKYAERPAYTCFGHALSYAEWDRLAGNFASYIQHHTDLKPGDRIAIQLPNLLQYPVVLLGAMRAGLIVVNTNPLYTSTEMQHQFADSGAKALVIHRCMASKAEPILADTQIRHVITTEIGDLHPWPKRALLNAAVKYIKKMQPPYHLANEVPLREALDKGAGQAWREVRVHRHDTVMLQYTGGTTGVAKGAMLTHDNLIANMSQVKTRLSSVLTDSSMTFVAPLPLYHIYAFTMHCMSLGSAGHHSLLITNPRDIAGFIKELKKWHIQGFVGLNTLFVALCDNAEFRQLDFSQLVLTSSGGMALSHAVAERWQSITGCPILEGYGLTETSPVVSFNPPDNNQLGTIGLPVEWTDCRLLDNDGRDVLPGMPGELCVRGPQVMKGYWQRPEETTNVLTAEGYIRTGDIAVRQEDGFLRIVDRRKDMIIVSGFNVYPNEVEDALMEHPDVVECAAVGMPDEKSGEAIKVFVVRRNPTLNEEVLRTFCLERLTRYKVPKQIVFRDELPKSNVGKILRRALRDSDQQRIAS